MTSRSILRTTPSQDDILTDLRRRRRYRVVMVDDDRGDYIMVSRLLSIAPRGQFELHHIDNVEAAVEHLRDAQYDAALIDYTIGPESGLDLLRRLGGRSASTPMIMLTGASAGELDLMALEAGAIDYLDKNELSPQSLARAIVHAHARFDVERQLQESQRELRAARDRAETANRAKSDFLARMSHEFRTPLNAIIGFSDAIRMFASHPDAAERAVGYAGHIEQSSAHLLDLVNDLLDLSRIETGHYEPARTWVDSNDAIQQVLNLHEIAADEKSITLEYHRPAESPLILADDRAVRQMLTNLLSNAIKFTDPGGRIDVTLQETEDHLDIMISDNGIGMSTSDISRALEPFEQLADHGEGKGHGSGLGLTIVNSLIEAHQGSLVLRSRLGMGTAATLRFPSAAVEYDLPQAS